MYPGPGGGVLTPHEHGVQAGHLGGEERVDAVQHGKEVGELQLLGKTQERGKWVSVGLGAHPLYTGAP